MSMSIREWFNDWFNFNSTFVVAFEGPRGVGKTKQAKLFCKWLSLNVNQPVVYLQNPFRLTDFSKQVYNCMMEQNKSAEEYALLGLLNKRLLQDWIANNPNTIFVVDRWDLSFWVYQIKVPDLDSKDKSFSTWAVTYPDKVQANYQVLLTCSRDVLYKRSEKIKESLNPYETPKFIQQSIEAYDSYYKLGDKCVVDTTLSNVEDTQMLIQDMFVSFLNIEKF